MHFAYPLPWWAFVLLVAVAVLVGVTTYGLGLPAGIRSSRSDGRVLLAGLRASVLLLLLLVLFRPLVIADQQHPRSGIVPILIDQSRSMRIADAGGHRRIDAAVGLLEGTLLPRLSGRFEPQVFGFGDALSITVPDRLSSPDDRRTDLDAALRAVRDRYRDRPLAGVIVVSDGGVTDDDSSPPPLSTPVFTVGVGGAVPDREVISLAAGASTLAASLVDLDASVMSRGLGSQPFDVRLVARRDGPEGGSASPGTAVDVRHVTPVDGVPARIRFSIPAEATPTVYSVEIPSDPREAVRENNVASILVTPAGRKRRVLFVEGAPGFEHSFLRRAWAADPAIEVDSVVRKGKNDQGQDAFLVQADATRAAALMTGYPTTKAGLFGYDAIVFGNVEWDFLTRDQLAMTRDFVGQRGGGVLVLGARSFASSGLAGTALEEALPLTLASGRPSVAPTVAPSAPASVGTSGKGAAGDNKLRLTSDGRHHAIMRIAPSSEDSERQWSALPPLAAINLLGAARPGGSVLAVAEVNGSARPVVAVQRYGRGRTAEFAGEGAWRWKMLMPTTDRTHELFWRQVIRWLSVDAPDQVAVAPVDGAQPGVPARLDVLVADGEYHPVASAVVSLRVTGPDGATRVANASLADQSTGRYSASVRIDRPGVYHVDVDARKGAQVLGTASRAFLAGASDPEFADPRLNDAVLRRIAAQSGGTYLLAQDGSALPDLLQKGAASVTVAAQPRDLWQHPIVFAVIATLLGAEWVLRRKRGLA